MHHDQKETPGGHRDRKPLRPLTLYILLGFWFEERDLMAEHGEQYEAYRRRVRALIPIPRRAGR